VRLPDSSSLVTPICHRQTNESCNAKMLTCASKMATSFQALREVLPRGARRQPIRRRCNALCIVACTKKSVTDNCMSLIASLAPPSRSFPQFGAPQTPESPRTPGRCAFLRPSTSAASAVSAPRTDSKALFRKCCANLLLAVVSAPSGIIVDSQGGER